MLPEAWPTPAEIIGDLLRRHPDAQALFGEASHCQGLVATSTASCEAKFHEAQAARRRYDELRHRLDPRGGHPVNFTAGAVALAVLSGGLVLLDWAELGGLLAGPELLLLSVGATAVWGTVATLAALAVRRRQSELLWALAGIAVALGLLLAWHGSVGPPGRWLGGIVAGAFILMLTGTAAALLAHTEPSSLHVARRRWHQAQAEQEWAVRIREADVEAATLAREPWLSLVRCWVTAVVGQPELMGETVALAAALLGTGQPMLPG